MEYKKQRQQLTKTSLNLIIFIIIISLITIITFALFDYSILGSESVKKIKELLIAPKVFSSLSK